jgi:hypothetical protein
LLSKNIEIKELNGTYYKKNIEINEVINGKHNE